MIKKNKKFSLFLQKGVSLYFAIVILSVLTAVLFSLITISLSQIKTIWSSGDSVTAFYAADNGIEEVLYSIYKSGYVPILSDCPASGVLANGASYQVCVSDISTSTIYSKGVYKNTQRKIEINL
jgi:hypothetical protein